MTDTSPPSTDTGYTDPVDPDFENSEQNDVGGQAQDVASDAMLRQTDLTRETERGGSTNPAQMVPDDVPDLVETMNSMVNSGRIDNGAFEGEPMLDDEEDILGFNDSDDDGDDLREEWAVVALAGRETEAAARGRCGNRWRRTLPLESPAPFASPAMTSGL